MSQEMIITSETTFDNCAEVWLAYIRRRRKYATYVRYRSSWERHLSPVLGSRPAALLTPAEIESVLITIVRENALSPSSFDSILTVLRQSLRHADISMNLENAVANVRYETQNLRPPKLRRALTHAEQQSLKDVLLTGIDIYKLALYICLMTGLRIGEVCALQKEDLQMERRCLSVRRTVQRLRVPANAAEAVQQVLDLPRDGVKENVMDNSENEEIQENRQNATESMSRTKLIISEPKSSSSVRDVPICTPLAKVLEESAYLLNGNSSQPSPGSTGQDIRDTIAEPASEGTFLFSGTRPLEPRTLQNHFSKIAREAGIEDTTVHTLRHTFATGCIAGGMDPKVLSEILGHADVRTTLNLYVHPDFDTKMRQLEKVTCWNASVSKPKTAEKMPQALPAAKD